MSEYIVGNNLDVMKCWSENYFDLIYIDPPFFTQRDWVSESGKFTDRWNEYTVSYAENAAWENVRYPFSLMSQIVFEMYGDAAANYFLFMSARLQEMQRLLKPTGTMYVHCDSSASHLIRFLLDIHFGKSNFGNEIAWCYYGPVRAVSKFPNKHDTIYRYTKTSDFVFNVDDVRIPYSPKSKPSVSTNHKRFGKDAKFVLHPKGRPSYDYWTDITTLTNHSERVGYPTQKPVKLLERIIKASSNPGDIVLDCFAGSGTTLIAAERLGRDWIGIDINADAKAVFEQRLETIR